MKEKDICKLFYRLASEMNELNQFSHKFLIMHIPNERIKTSTKDTFYSYNQAWMGTKFGCADYLIAWDTGCAFIEFKRNRKCKMTKNQEVFAANCRELGIPYFLTWDVDEVIDFMKTL